MYRFTVQQYRRMVETGILSENDMVELLEGWIVAKMTHNPPHDAAVNLTRCVIEPLLASGWHVRVQSAITTGDSEPEPDIAVVRGSLRRYVQSHPRPADIGLLIEVAETSLLEDRIDKGRLYARARIPIYWIVNIPERQVEIYTDPKGGKSPAYRRRHDYGINDKLPLVIDGQEIARIAVKSCLP
jgi:Uma2 family endonuclease